MVENLNTILDVGELEEGKQSIIGVFDLVVDDHGEADSKVGCSQATKTNEGFLTDGGPWRVTDTKEDGLQDVSIAMVMDWNTTRT